MASLALLILFLALPSLAQRLTLTPHDKTGIYDLGEKAGWTVTLAGGAPAPSGNYTYTIKKNNQAEIKSGELDLSTGSANIDISLNEPALLYVQVMPPAGGGAATNSDGAPPSRGRGGRGGMVVGAAIAPAKLQPSTPPPPDFDSFWEAKIKMLQDIPENAVLIPGESGRTNVQYFTITMDHIQGAHVHGQLAKPRKEGKFPALLIFQWASPPYPLQKPWVTDRAAEGWLTLNIEPHDVLPDQPPAYYAALPDELKNYQAIGREDRDRCYFLQMYLADYRAVDYLARRPDWDGKTLVVMGTSMGGQQSLCVAGLHPKVTHVIVNEPSGCDANGPLHGRASGYPNWPSGNPKIMQTAPYFDPVNFASHIKAPALVSMGFIDTIAPPVGIWTAFNQIKGPKEAVPMLDSPHNNLATPAQQRPYTTRSAEWLDILVKGGEINPHASAGNP
ncbi:MAG: acetylxylan esterase [Verrucomicrobiota bacterium]|jgi:cephalosporin-C deacetylase-like acetyl esterase